LADGAAVAADPDALEVDGDIEAPPDRGEVDGPVTGVEADVVFAAQPNLVAPARQDLRSLAALQTSFCSSR
jgi:hypothetical protein